MAEIGLASATLLPFAYYYSKIKLSKAGNLQRQNKQHSSKLQVLLPIWNEELVIHSKLENLAQEINSLDLNHNHQVSLLIVDSASTDSSLEICKKWLENNPNIFESSSIIEMPERLGKSAAVVLALEEIHNGELQPDLVFMTDADAILEPGCLEYLLSWFSKDKFGAVGATPNRKKALSSEAVHRDMFSMLREYESNVGSTSMLEGSGIMWRKELVEPSDLFIDSNADDAQIATTVLSKGRRVIQDPNARFIDFAPSKFSDQFRQKKRRGQGLIVNFLRSRKKIKANREIISKETLKNFRMNYYFHVIAPFTALGFMMVGITRYAQYALEGGLPSIRLSSPELPLICFELVLLSSIILSRLGVRIPILSYLSSLASGMHALLSGWLRIIIGKPSNLWDQHIDTRIDRD